MTDTTKLLDEAIDWLENTTFVNSYGDKRDGHKQLDVAIAALRFAKAMQPMPIDEAPRDGTKVLTWSKIVGWREAYCIHGDWQDIDVILDGEWEPTHFTPLPDQALKEFEEALK